MSGWITLLLFFLLTLLPGSRTQVNYDPVAAKDVELAWSNKSINPSIVPVPRAGVPLDVEIAFFINTVVSVNPADQTASIVGTLVLNWTDTQLEWNTTNITTNQVVAPSKSIWTPEFQLISGVSPDLNVRLDSRFDRVIVNSKGNVISKLSRTFTSRCDAHTESFPYDSQTCDFTFKLNLPSYLVSLKKMNVTETEMKTDFTDNSEWMMLSFKTSVDAPTETVTMENLGMKTEKFDMKLAIFRKPYYYLVLLVVPILMSTILLIIIPLIPMHSGERLGFTTNLFLAFVLFLLLVDNMLPKSSFSSLTISMTISVVLVLLNLFETIIVIYFDDLLNSRATATATTTVFPMSPEPPDSPEPVDGDHLEAPEEETTARRSRSQTDVMKKNMTRLMKQMTNLMPRPQNPRLLMHRVDRGFAILNFLVVICANLYIASKLIPRYAG